MKDKLNVKVGVLMYTYDRIDDARINLEILRNVWPKCGLLKDVVVVHAFNGDQQWWPEKYLEDELLFLENPGHFGGAEVLLNQGIKCFADKYPQVAYVIILAPDTWCVMPEYLEKIIDVMHGKDKYLAACAWGTKDKSDMFVSGMSMDFNIVDVKWAVEYRLFPLRYQEFSNRYAEVFSYEDKIVYLERVFALRFKQAIMRAIEIPSDNLIKQIAEEHICRMTEREPVHCFHRPISRLFRAVHRRKEYWPNIGLITHHNPMLKQEVAKEWNLKLGNYGARFLAANNLSYYNNGLIETAYMESGKAVRYKD